MTDDIKAIRDALAAGPTPGPWEQKEPEEDKQYLRIRGRRLGGRFKIANVAAPKIALLDSELQSREDAESAANAAYIAACHPERIARLLDALELAQKDAERYRAMREPKCLSWPIAVFDMREPMNKGKPLPYECIGNRLDAAIDAAMKGQE